MRRPGRPARRGFSLIDTIAAVVVLAIAVPPMLWSLRAAHDQRVDPVLASTARWLATEKLEDAVGDRHSTTRGWSWLVPGNYPAEPGVAGFPAFGRTVTLTETGPDLALPGSGYMTIVVAVSWTDATGTGRTLTVSTVVTEYS